MKYSDIKSAVLAVITDHPDFTFYIEGPPGTGKTANNKDIAAEYLRRKGVAEENLQDRTTLLSPSTLDPVDIAGIPSLDNGMTKFNPTYLVGRHREGMGPGVIIIDELDKAGSAQMQNVMATLILERKVGLMQLDPETVIIATGNRTQDKAGGSKLLTHLGNRICIIEMEANVDDTTAYFMDTGVDPQLIAFLRLRPDLLHNFDPNRPTNPTPRSWEKGARCIPETLPIGQYQALWTGVVGEGAAVEWAAAKEIMREMPNPDMCILQPDATPVPEKPAAQHAITTALALKTDPNNFDRAWQYIQRLPRERHVVYMLDVSRRDKSMMNHKAFVQFVLKNQDIFIPN